VSHLPNTFSAGAWAERRAMGNGSEFSRDVGPGCATGRREAEPHCMLSYVQLAGVKEHPPTLLAYGG